MKAASEGRPNEVQKPRVLAAIKCLNTVCKEKAGACCVPF